MTEIFDTGCQKIHPAEHQMPQSGTLQIINSSHMQPLTHVAASRFIAKMLKKLGHMQNSRGREIWDMSFLNFQLWLYMEVSWKVVTMDAESSTRQYLS